MLNICDLSSNNSEAQQKQAILENDGVIVKATEGISYVNPFHLANAQLALANDKVIGFYHYARPENNSYEKEALHFVNNCRPYIGKAILALDWEGNALKVNQQWARNFLDVVYQITGVRPLLYCSEAYLKKVGAVVADGNYGLWVAKYSSKNPVITPWKVKALWQYTSKPYDKSKFYGDKEAWAKYAKRG